VHTELEVMADPPKADILLLRRKHPEWTPEQLERLPDGIRDSGADHILLEFKYSESVGLSAFRQAVGYDYFYKDSKELTDWQVRTFLVSSKTTRKATLDRFGYSPTGRAGVYHPASVTGIGSPADPERTLRGTAQCLYQMLCKPDKGENGRLQNIERSEYRPAFRETALVSARPVETLVFQRRCANETGTDPRTGHGDGENVGRCLSFSSGSRKTSGLEPEERLRGLEPGNIVKTLGTENIVKTIGLKELLKGMSVKEIEAYLRKRKKKK